MIGGYSLVAAELNRAFIWPGGKEITRQQIEAWHKRRTLNQLQQLPPSAIEDNPDTPRTVARWTFETAAWIEWARSGVPGPRRAGWVEPRPREGWETPWPGWTATHQLLIRRRHRDPLTGHWVITHPNRKPERWPPAGVAS